MVKQCFNQLTVSQHQYGFELRCSQFLLAPVSLSLHSKHNDNTWTVPGGNVEDADSSLLGTATREAMEELGSVPPFEVKAQILTK